MNTTTSFDPWLGSEKVAPSDTGDPVRIVFGPRGVPPMPVPADASAFASVADMEAYIARLDDPDAGLPALGSSGGTCPNCHQTEVLCVGWKYRGLEDTLYRCPACAHEATAGELADAIRAHLDDINLATCKKRCEQLLKANEKLEYKVTYLKGALAQVEKENARLRRWVEDSPESQSELVRDLAAERDLLAHWKESHLKVESWWQEVSDAVREHPGTLVNDSIAAVALRIVREDAARHYPSTDSPCTCDACSSERPRPREWWLNSYRGGWYEVCATRTIAEAARQNPVLQETIHVREVPQ